MAEALLRAPQVVWVLLQGLQKSWVLPGLRQTRPLAGVLLLQVAVAARLHIMDFELEPVPLPLLQVALALLFSQLAALYTLGFPQQPEVAVARRPAKVRAQK